MRLTRTVYLVEEKLELFIGQVDARLLKAVVLKMFKAKYIKDTWKEQEIGTKFGEFVFIWQ